MAGSLGYQVRVRVQGELDPAWWSAQFEGLAIVPEPDGTTVLRGGVRDQAELHGFIAVIRDLGLSLLSVETMPATSAPKGDPR